MIRRLRSVRFCAFNPCFAADAQWVKARLGSFETISDNGRRSAVQGLSQFEQFRFALGTAMGKPDLRLDPPLRILVFKTAQEMPPGCDTVHTGRDHLWPVSRATKPNCRPALIRELTAPPARSQLLQSARADGTRPRKLLQYRAVELGSRHLGRAAAARRTHPRLGAHPHAHNAARLFGAGSHLPAQSRRGHGFERSDSQPQ